MKNKVKVLIPFDGNEDVSILLILKNFVALMEIDLEEVKRQVENFRQGKDVICFVDEVNLSKLEEWMQGSRYRYEVEKF